MLTFRNGIFAGLSLMLGIACGSDNATGVSPQLVGTYDITKDQETQQASPQTVVDQIALGHVETATFEASGRAIFTDAFQGVTVADTNTWKATATRLIFTRTGNPPDTSSYTFVSPTLTVTNPNNFDFGSGAEAADRLIIGVKQ